MDIPILAYAAPTHFIHRTLLAAGAAILALISALGLLWELLVAQWLQNIRTPAHPFAWYFLGIGIQVALLLGAATAILCAVDRPAIPTRGRWKKNACLAAMVALLLMQVASATLWCYAMDLSISRPAAASVLKLLMLSQLLSIAAQVTRMALLVAVIFFLRHVATHLASPAISRTATWGLAATIPPKLFSLLFGIAITIHYAQNTVPLPQNFYLINRGMILASVLLQLAVWLVISAVAFFGRTTPAAGGN